MELFCIRMMVISFCTLIYFNFSLPYLASLKKYLFLCNNILCCCCCFVWLAFAVCMVVCYIINYFHFFKRIFRCKLVLLTVRFHLISVNLYFRQVSVFSHFFSQWFYKYILFFPLLFFIFKISAWTFNLNISVWIPEITL